MEALKESVAQMSQLFQQRLAEFEERQQRLDSTTGSSSSNLAAEFSCFKAFTLDALRALQAQVELVAREVENIQMHGRRKILLLHGCKESANEDISSIVVKMVTEKLKLSTFKPQDITRCHRMGKSPSPDRPRPILFKLGDTTLRSKLWAAKSSLKGSGITLSEFLTKSRHDTFMAARLRFGVLKSWTRDGSVYVLTASGERHRVNSIADLNGLCEQSAPVNVAPKQAVVKEPALTTKTKRAAASKK